MDSEKYEQLLQMQQKLHEANFKSLTADLELAWIYCNRKDEELADIQNKFEIQAEELEVTEDHLGRVGKKVSIYRKECYKKEEELDAIRGMYSTKLQYTEDRLRVS